MDSRSQNAEEPHVAYAALWEEDGDRSAFSSTDRSIALLQRRSWNAHQPAPTASTPSARDCRNDDTRDRYARHFRRIGARVDHGFGENGIRRCCPLSPGIRIAAHRARPMFAQLRIWS